MSARRERSAVPARMRPACHDSGIDRSTVTTDVAFAGLDEEEARRRAAEGRVNAASEDTSRTVREILRSNILTRFNALLGSLLVVILIVGPLKDALFGLALIANTMVGIAQEVRAKRALDRLAVVTAPRATVIRDGVTSSVAATEVVLDDLMVVARGDQVVVDGRVVETSAVQIDESLLTGESEPVRKAPGDAVLSGSIIVAGSARCMVTAVGEASYAARLSSAAREYSLASSELR